MMTNKIYISPTTPDLKIDFRAYIIELVCLNIKKDLKPYFWKDKTWSDKFKREIAGFKWWVKDHESYILDEKIRKGMVYAIRSTRCKSILSKFNRSKLTSIVYDFCNKNEIKEFESEKNKTIVDVTPINKFNKIREIEKNGQKNSS